MTLIMIIIITTCRNNLLLSYLENSLLKPIESEVGKMCIAFSFSEANNIFFHYLIVLLNLSLSLTPLLYNYGGKL
jgi:hypothetical protein